MPYQGYSMPYNPARLIPPLPGTFNWRKQWRDMMYGPAFAGLEVKPPGVRQQPVAAERQPAAAALPGPFGIAPPPAAPTVRSPAQAPVTPQRLAQMRSAFERTMPPLGAVTPPGAKQISPIPTMPFAAPGKPGVAALAAPTKGRVGPTTVKEPTMAPTVPPLPTPGPVPPTPGGKGGGGAQGVTNPPSETIRATWRNLVAWFHGNGFDTGARLPAELPTRFTVPDWILGFLFPTIEQLEAMRAQNDQPGIDQHVLNLVGYLQEGVRVANRQIPGSGYNPPATTSGWNAVRAWALRNGFGWNMPDVPAGYVWPKGAEIPDPIALQQLVEENDTEALGLWRDYFASLASAFPPARPPVPPGRGTGVPATQAAWDAVRTWLTSRGLDWGLSAAPASYVWGTHDWQLPTIEQLQALWVATDVESRKQLETLKLVLQGINGQLQGPQPGASNEPRDSEGDSTDPDSYTGGRTNTWDDLRNFVAWYFGVRAYGGLTAEQIARGMWAVNNLLPSVDYLIATWYYAGSVLQWETDMNNMMRVFYDAALGYTHPTGGGGGGGDRQARQMYANLLKRYKRVQQNPYAGRGAVGGTYRPQNWY